MTEEPTLRTAHLPSQPRVGSQRPWLVAAAYLVDWAMLMIVRERSIRALRPWFAGFAEGWRADPGERRPISWRTIWRMARAGRPPVI